jgi:hypothetical protein
MKTLVCSFVLTQKNQKVKAVRLSLENGTAFHCLHPNSQTPFTNSSAEESDGCAQTGVRPRSISFVFYAIDVRPVTVSARTISGNWKHYLTAVSNVYTNFAA